jgi:hypothetical protein
MLSSIAHDSPRTHRPFFGADNTVMVSLSWPDCQPSTLIVIEAQALTSELFVQDEVLFVKILDDVLLALV